MTFTAVLLLLISAVIHAGWNLLSKREHPTAAFFLAANTIGALCLIPVLFFRWEIVHMFPVKVWSFLVLTGLFQAIYFISLAGAYRLGDMSIAYPLARSSPAIMVMLVTLLLGRGGQVSTGCILGILLVVGGSFLLPMKSFRDFHLGNYLQATCLLALLAACGTTGYSMIDDTALRLLRATYPASPYLQVLNTLLYAFFEAWTSSAWLALFVLTGKRGRADLHRVLRTSKLNALLTGAGMYIGYPLVLISMAFVANISYVVAFRQISIPLGATFAMILLHEKRYAPRIAGVIVMFAGLVMVGRG